MLMEKEKNICSFLGCNRETEEGSDYCLKHGGAFVRKRKKIEGLRNYRLNRYKQRANELVESEKLKDLRDEVAILRILLEERFNACEDTATLILHSGTISDLILKINQLVTSCHKLDLQLGDMLDREVVMEMADKIIELISEEVNDSEALDRISESLTEILTMNKIEEVDSPV